MLDKQQNCYHSDNLTPTFIGIGQMRTKSKGKSSGSGWLSLRGMSLLIMILLAIIGMIAFLSYSFNQSKADAPAIVGDFHYFSDKELAISPSDIKPI